MAESSKTTLELLGATVGDGVTAINIIVAMSAGLLIPKLVIDRFQKSVTLAAPEGVGGLDGHPRA
jgi:hypothetical protein